MARYSVGIDLGTTHSAVSYFRYEEGKGRGASQAVLPIPQVTAPGTVESRPLLPSFLYLPSAAEFPKGAVGLPWQPEPGVVVGEFARTHGAKVPTRLVSSAKSWLSHAGVDRREKLLPWGAPEEVTRVSPVDASVRYLTHLKEAWDSQLGGDPLGRLSAQDVVLTVPASFDAAARELTEEAANKAGLQNVVLLEEPQAALYAWIEAQGDAFRKVVKPGDVILVVDVGGGTTDFSLIAVVDQGGEVGLQRLAVGDHILLGGDNMDLALAHTLSAKLATTGKKLDAWQLGALTFACRQAKETLFADPSLPSAPLAVASRGSSLLGGTIRVDLERAELERILVEGFFPQVTASAVPKNVRSSGLVQMALPYAQDAAVTKHLGHFLTRQQRALSEGPALPVKLAGKSFVHPTAVLFNGGVFKASPLKARVLDVLQSWLAAEGAPPAKELPGADLDLSVARGAAYYGWVRQGHGVRIRGGTARSYYVGVESAMPAVPGMEPPVKALCVAPFGMEEGTEAPIPPQEFGLWVGEPTRFRFFASSVRRQDKVGDLLDDVLGGEDFEELNALETTLPSEGSAPSGRPTPVNLQAAVTEVGLLELRCLEKAGGGKWKLTLNVREDGE